MAATLYTFGYEGLSITLFIARLKAAGIESVIDVRELPLSRKPGFSKRALANALQNADVAYAHVPALGCPRPIRERYRSDGDWIAYRKGFEKYLTTQKGAVADLVRSANSSTTCLVCFEADFNHCHRKMVADAAVGAGGPRVSHLTATLKTPGAIVRAVA
jgi:uncharacterized protein (DUF488 family)